MVGWRDSNGELMRMLDGGEGFERLQALQALLIVCGMHAMRSPGGKAPKRAPCMGVAGRGAHPAPRAVQVGPRIRP